MQKQAWTPWAKQHKPTQARSACPGEEAWEARPAHSHQHSGLPRRLGPRRTVSNLVTQGTKQVLGQLSLQDWNSHESFFVHKMLMFRNMLFTKYVSLNIRTIKGMTCAPPSVLSFLPNAAHARSRSRSSQLRPGDGSSGLGKESRLISVAPG